jgi:hypothetical protein
MSPATKTRTYACMQNAVYFCPHVIKFGYFQHIFMESSVSELHVSRSTDSRTDAYEQTDRPKQALDATVRTYSTCRQPKDVDGLNLAAFRGPPLEEESRRCYRSSCLLLCVYRLKDTEWRP